MAEFQAITTQEQFDAAISERLKREREALTKKYADYDSLNGKIADYEKQLGDYSKTIEAQNQKYAGYDTQLSDLQSKLKGYEQSSVKMRIAHEAGIPFELAARLAGETEDDIRKDAQSMAQFISKPNVTAPLKNSEPMVDKRSTALKAFTEQLTNKGE